jgi:oligoribonuclease
MPDFEDYFHYRNLDVSTVKELARRWKPEVLDKVVKTGAHLALDDILESIAEMKVYQEHFFKL